MLSVPGAAGGPSSGFGPGSGGEAGSASAGGDFLARYRLVSAKLRRRFLRKPNVSEAAEQFAALARELRAQESLPYAAWCQLAVARCAQSLGHAPGEAAALGEAARLWLRHERELRARQGGPPGLGLAEHLPAAQSCVAFGARLRLELGQPALAAGLWLELGGELRAAGEPGQAVPALLRAAELLAAAPLPLEALRCLRHVASCLLLGRDYDGALAVLTQAQQQLLAQAGSGDGSLAPAAAPPPPPGSARASAAAASGSSAPTSQLPGAFLDELLHCEVTRVLLLLLLQPPPSKLLPEHAQTLEKYSWEALDAPSGYLPPELFLLLQSAVMACQEKDLEALKVLQKALWPLLSPEQNHLLHLVVQEMISPSGQGV